MVTVGQDAAASWLVAFNRLSRASDPKMAWRTSEQRFGSVEATLLTSAASILATHFHNVELLKEGESLFTEIIKALVNAMEARDPYTRGHSERVARYCRLLGQAYGLDEEACESLHLSGLLHDVGKIAISDVVLQKPDGLTDEEFAELKRHPSEGRTILQDLGHLQGVMSGVYYHHERYDGKGYPCGLAAEEIPLEGRIMAVCDAYDAMTSDRPYRKAISQEKAEAILRDGAGSQWDAHLVELFLSIMPDVLRVGKQLGPDESVPADQDAIRG
jgi:HD-GYP domain-containing protein (c-di-GMP phosphodiesterase class II)